MNQTHRKNQSESGAAHQEESFVNVSDPARLDGTLQESLLLQGSVEEELDEEFSMGSSVYKAPDIEQRQVLVPPSRLEALRQEQVKAGMFGDNSSAPTSLNQSFNKFALTGQKPGAVFNQSNMPSFDLGSNSKLFSATTHQRSSGASPIVFNYQQQRQAANQAEASDASRSQSPDVLPGYPKINTQGMTTIRNQSDGEDDDIRLRQPGMQGPDDSGMQEEFKHGLQDHHMTQQNNWKRGRQELNQQHEEFQQNYSQWDDQQNAFNDARDMDRAMRDHRQHQNPSMITVSRAQLSGKMKSKTDIYKILTKEGQLYLPPLIECPMIFIKDILMGKKKVFRNSEVSIVDVPYFEEMTAKRIMLDIRNSNLFKSYLPDIDFASKKILNRKYLFNIVNTLDPGFFPANIRDAYRQRKERHEDRGNAKLSINAELFDLIQGSNQIIHNRGRALAYMGNADKKRKLDNGQGAATQQRVHHHYQQARPLATNSSGGGLFQSDINANQHHLAVRNHPQSHGGGVRQPNLTPSSIADHINNMGVNLNNVL